jgi:hypothetical protein
MGMLVLAFRMGTRGEEAGMDLATEGEGEGGEDFSSFQNLAASFSIKLMVRTLDYYQHSFFYKQIHPPSFP